MLLLFLRGYSGTARSAGPGILMQARQLYPDSGLARVARAPE
jgi:hypothetical protein